MRNGKKDILLHLYGEASEAEELRSLLRDDELRREYSELSEVKFRLDHIKPERPDQAAIDQILAAAVSGEGLPDSGQRKDRPAVAPRYRLRKVLLPALSIAAAVMFGIAIGWFGTSSSSGTVDQPALVERASDLVPPESLYRFVPPSQRLTPASSAASRLAWDDSSPILEMHRRIEDMSPDNPLDWGEQAVPLESLPGSRGRGLQMTGSNK